MPNPSHPYALALDVGGSHVTGAAVDLDDRRVLPHSVSRRHTSIDDPAAKLIEAWSGAALDALTQAGLKAVERAGVAMPGPFDYAQGVSWHVQKFTALYGLNVKQMMLSRWEGTPLAGALLRFANDAALWALGEWWLGSLQGTRRLIGVTLGTGLGSGFIDEGKLVISGERVPPEGQVWNTPYLDDIAERYAAGAALSRSYHAATGLEVTPAEIAARAENGDESACAVFQDFGAHLADIFAPWVAKFQPDCLVVGGNIARAWPLFRDALRAGLPGLACRVTEHFEESSLLGAAAYTE